MADEPQQVRRDAEETARRLAAAISGAIEGFLLGLEEQDLAGEARESAKVAGEVAREAGTEVKAQAQTPEMRELGEQAKHAASATAYKAAQATDAAKATAHDVKETFVHAKDTVATKVEDVKEGVRVRAEAVRETGRRAREAPRKIGHELREAVGVWWSSLVTALAMGALVAVVGVATFVVLTIALVVGLNQLLGDPLGTWIVVGVYAILMIALWAIMRSQRTRARHEVRERLDNSREEARHVAAPVRRAFGGRGSV